MSQFKLLSKNFICICLSSFLYFGSFYLLLPVLPQFVASLGGTTSQIGLVTGFFTMVSVLIRPYCGKLADKYGRKKLLLFGAGLFALLFFFYDRIQAVVPLYLLRILHGVAHGSYLAAAYAYVADLAPVERRGEVMGIYGAANVLAMALFPAWGSSLITGSQDFSTLFMVAIATAAAGFLAVAGIDERKPSEEGPPNVSILAVIRLRAVLVASLTLFAAATVYGAVITFLPVYAPGRGIVQVGIFFTTYAAFTLISRIVAGKLSDRFGRRAVILPCLTFVAIAAFLLPFLQGIYGLAFIGGLFGFGFGAFMPALNAFVVDEVSPRERASALAVFTSFMDVGITTGAVVLGIIGELRGYAVMFGLGGVVVVLGILLFAVGARASYLQKKTADSAGP
ncbi:MAG TPA: MFS transporter [Methylomusa anaerophila]|uniref:Tetracycline resistance protein, class B n=1 Tax=Methylomusa anaerophila TaxID=1930071 RepID=A0A348AK54_9FIRM|nr:MFS transporter [Methylomusa anaerophila]BBB91452.1 tetracycline resistance protein, class B [Methylomusa anaerophila]HML89960.1 MFS transporter [Methylomusa anaerophila]